MMVLFWDQDTASHIAMSDSLYATVSEEWRQLKDSLDNRHSFHNITEMSSIFLGWRLFIKNAFYLYFTEFESWQEETFKESYR